MSQRNAVGLPLYVLASVQAPIAAAAAGENREEAARAAADRVTGPLPHAERLQQAFGEHDLSSVHAAVGGEGGAHAEQLGAEAYTNGERIAFRREPDVWLAAHEAAHVVQQRRGVTPSPTTPRARDPHEQEADAVADAVAGGGSVEHLLGAPGHANAEHRDAVQRFGPQGWGDCSSLDDFRTAAHDPSLRECWRNFADLGALPDRAAFELIFEFKRSAFYQTLWPDAALAFFLFHPDTALSVLGEAIGDTRAADAGDVLLVLNAGRFVSRGPGPDAAYGKLDDWLDTTSIPSGGPVRELVAQRQATHVIDRMIERVRKTWGYDETHPDWSPGPIFFVEEMRRLRDTVTRSEGSGLAALGFDLAAIESVVAWAADRFDELGADQSNLQAQVQWADTPDSTFYRDVLLPPWGQVFAAADDFARLREMFDAAEQTYANRTQLWLDYRIRGFEHALGASAPAEWVAYPLTNGSGLRTAANDVWQTWTDKRDALLPRVAKLRARFGRSEHVDFEEIYALQRDAYIVTALYACARSVFGMFNAWEQLEKIEGQVIGDFDELQAELVRDADQIHAIVTSDGDLVKALDLLDGRSVQTLPDRIDHEIRDAEDNTRLATLAIMVAATIASAGAAALIETGALAMLGTTIGATALGALDVGLFILEVGTFTLTYDGLSAAAFGHPFDWSALPSHFVENAILFGALKWVGGRTLKLFGNENVGLLRGLGQFAARHAINLGTFGATAVGMQVYKTGHLPPSWRELAEDTVGAYVVLGTLGFALGKLRVQVRARFLVEPRLRLAGKRMDQMTAIQADVDRMLAKLGIADEAAGGEQTKPATPERLRERVAELARLARQIVEDLEVTSAITPEDAAALRDAIDLTARRLHTARRGFGADGLPDIATLEGVTPLGDGRTYQFGTDTMSALRKALFVYTERGYVLTIDPVTGDLKLADPSGVEIARFQPQLGARITNAWLARQRISPEARTGLSRLRPEAFSQMNRLSAQVLEALGALARRSPDLAQQALDSGLLVLLGRKPQVAVRLLELASDMQNLAFADTHVHVIGAIPPAELLLERLRSAGNEREVREKLGAVIRIVEGVLARLPEGDEATQKQQDWAVILPQLEALAESLLGDLHDSETSVATGRLAHNIELQLHELLALRATGGEGMARDVFFYLYDQIRQGAWKAGRRGAIVGRAADAMAARRTAYVELRSGMPEDLREQLEANGIVGPDGTPVENARVVIVIKRGDKFDAAATQRLFDAIRNHPVLSRVIVGFDLVGEEATANRGQYQMIADQVLLHNFRELSRMLAARPDVLDAAAQQLGGVPPLDFGDALVPDLESSPSDPRAAGFARSELGRINRALAEAATRLGAELPNLFGLTAHAGEEVGQTAGSQSSAPVATLDLLLASVEASLDSGVDRIGHGLVLGLSLPADLPKLGFRYEPSTQGIRWVRDLPGGQQEVYTSDQVYELEARRRGLVDRIAELGVTIEVNPSSNISLSGLDPSTYPMSQLLAARPDLRISVSTDNPAFHDTDAAMELAILAAVADAPFSRTALAFLEGYSSRLGQRSLHDAATLRGETLDVLVSRTPIDERAALLQLLEARYHLGEDVPLATPLAAAFRAALAPYLEVVFR
ncbi:MAG TPA: DUF4157 domain-containing protein [Kofleriaceae bacterium]